MLSASGNALSSDELASKAIGISEEYAAGRARYLQRAKKLLLIFSDRNMRLARAFAGSACR